MKPNHSPLLPLFFFVLLLSASCSTTKMLPPGEVLYTGIERIVVNDPANQRHRGADEVMGKVEEALAYAPNNALLGSSTTRTPLPIGLWVYNAHVGKKGRFHQWMYRWLAARPVTLTTVKPANRALAAQNVLHENGFFRGAARYEIIPDHKDSLKARVRYLVTLGEPYVIDSVRFRRMQDRSDTTIKWRDEERLLHRGDLFTLDRLEAERQRIATIMRNNGYYYFRPEYIEVQADSTKGDHLVDLRVRVRRDIPRDFIRKPWFLGRTAIRLIGYDGEEPTDSLTYGPVTIHYEGRLRLRPHVLFNALRYERGDRYSLAAQEETLAAMNKLRTFRFVDMQYTPTDTSAGRRLYNDLARELLPPDQAGTHNQAIMEFGALQCVPRNPDCSVCPLAARCAAHAAGTPERFPVKQHRTKTIDRYFHYFYVTTGDNLFLRRRPAGDIWQGLFELPLIETSAPADLDALMQTDDFRALFADTGSTQFALVAADVRHVLTHRILHATCYIARIERPSEALLRLTHTSCADLDRYPLPRLITLLIDRVDRRGR